MKRVPLAPLILLVCVSCAPPYDPDLSLATLILPRLTYQSAVSTGIIVDEYSPAYDVVYLPEKSSNGTLASVDPSKGFMVFTTSSGVSLMFIQPDGNGGFNKMPDPSLGPMGIGGLYGCDPNYPGFEVRTVWEGDYVAVFSYDSTQPSNSSAVIYWPSVSLTTLFAPQPLGGQFVSLMTNPVVVLGTQLSLTSTIGGDGQYLLARDGGGLIHEVFLNTVNFSGFSGALDLSGALPSTFSAIPAGLNRCMYFHDPVAGVSYSSYYTAGSWQCWRWEAGGANARRLSGISCRIDALLTTGELLSTQDGVGRLFDSEGKLLTSFPLGSLRYSMEAYVDGAATVYLSRKVVSGGSLSLELYSIPSTQVRSLSY